MFLIRTAKWLKKRPVTLYLHLIPHVLHLILHVLHL